MTAPTAPSLQQRELDLPQEITARAERGWDLHLAKRQLITKTGEDTYTVPSCTGKGTYTVHYGGESEALESCTCTDFQVRGDLLACKHLVAVALIYARRRRVFSRCEACGTPSSEKTLVGIRGDHRRGGPKFCLPHHPESLAGALADLTTVTGQEQ